MKHKHSWNTNIHETQTFAVAVDLNHYATTNYTSLSYTQGFFPHNAERLQDLWWRNGTIMALASKQHPIGFGMKGSLMFVRTSLGCPNNRLTHRSFYSETSEQGDSEKQSNSLQQPNWTGKKWPFLLIITSRKGQPISIKVATPVPSLLGCYSDVSL